MNLHVLCVVRAAVGGLERFLRPFKHLRLLPSTQASSEKHSQPDQGVLPPSFTPNAKSHCEVSVLLVDGVLIP